MALRRSWLLLALLAGAAITASLAQEDADLDVEEDDDYADADEIRARLLVVKGVSESDLVQGVNVTFTVEVYNAGQSSAKGVQITDKVPAGFELLEGATSLASPTISPGQTVKITYVAVPKQAGVATLPGVAVTYSSSDDDEVQKGASLPKQVAVLSTADKLYKQALKVGQYLTLGTVRTPQQWLNMGYTVGGVAALAGAGLGYKSLSEANKRWRYQRALKEVEKMQ